MRRRSKPTLIANLLKRIYFRRATRQQELPFELLKKMSAIQISQERTYDHWRMRLGKKEPIHRQPLGPILERQSKFVREIIRQRRQELLEEAYKKWHQRINTIR